MYTGRASGFTGAGMDNFQRAGQQIFRPVKSLPAKPGSTGDRVMDKYGGAVDLGMVDHGYPPQVIAVGHDQQRKNADGPMFDGVNTTHKMHLPGFHRLPDGLRNGKPYPFGFKNKGRQIQRQGVDLLMTANLPQVIAGDLIGHLQAPCIKPGPTHIFFIINFQNLSIFMGLDPGIIIDFGPGHLNAGCGKIQVIHNIGDPVMQIDGPGMGFPKGPVGIDAAPVVSGALFKNR